MFQTIRDMQCLQLKKITPGGHWIGITAVATRQAKSSLYGNNKCLH